jgi:hypothetical protein
MDLRSRRSARIRRGQVLLLAAAGAGALGLAAAVGLPVVRDEPAASSAYAIERNDDATVRVTIERFEDADGLEAAIKGYGIRAEVDYLPSGKVCRQPRYAVAATADQRAAVGVVGGSGHSILLRPGDFDADETLVIVHSGGGDFPSGGTVRGVQQLVARGRVASCVPIDLPPHR